MPKWTYFKFLMIPIQNCFFRARTKARVIRERMGSKETETGKISQKKRDKPSALRICLGQPKKTAASASTYLPTSTTRAVSAAMRWANFVLHDKHIHYLKKTTFILLFWRSSSTEQLKGSAATSASGSKKNGSLADKRYEIFIVAEIVFFVNFFFFVADQIKEILAALKEQPQVMV